MRTIVIIDINNLYYNVKKKYQSSINYSNFINKIRTDYPDIVKIFAYSEQWEENCLGFINLLSSLNIVTKFATRYTFFYSFLGQAFLDVVRYSDKIDRVIICSSNPDFQFLQAWLDEKGINNIVYSCRIPKILKYSNESKELDSGVLWEKDLESKNQGPLNFESNSLGSSVLGENSRKE